MTEQHPSRSTEAFFGRRKGKPLRTQQAGYLETVLPLLKLEQEGSIASAWGTSENNRRARFYRLTRAGRGQIARETREWRTTTDILAQFLEPKRAR